MSIAYMAVGAVPIAKDGLPEVLFHRDWREHPVIGFGTCAPRKSNSSKKASARSEAFMDLQTLTCVRREVPGVGGSLMTLHLIEGMRPSVDLAMVWNWANPEMRSFFTDLAEYNLIADDLAVELCRTLSTRSCVGKRSGIARRSRAAVLAKTGGVCTYCGVRLTIKPDMPNSYHADHVLPLNKGGTNDVGLLVPSCRTCNLKKQAKTALQFIGGAE